MVCETTQKCNPNRRAGKVRRILAPSCRIKYIRSVTVFFLHPPVSSPAGLCITVPSGLVCIWPDQTDSVWVGVCVWKQ